MDRHTVILLTPKGLEELKQRRYRLEPRLRMVLIMIDGQRTLDEIHLRAGQPEDFPTRMQHLWKAGFIQIAGDEGVESDRVPALIKTELMALAREMLGERSKKLTQRMAAAPDTREGILDSVQQCKKILRLTVDERLADTLEARCETILKRLEPG